MGPGASVDDTVPRLPCGPPVRVLPKPCRRRPGLLLGSVVLELVAGCGAGGTITVDNDGGTVVTVAFADEGVGEVEPDGGAVVHTDECLGSPVVVTYASGHVVELAGSVCPGQQLRIDDAGAELVAQTDG